MPVTREIRIGAGVQALVALAVVGIGGVVGTLTWLDGRYASTGDVGDVSERVGRLEALQEVVQKLVVRVEVLLDREERRGRPPGGPRSGGRPPTSWRARWRT